ncbi:MurR/RpiR family transcriptional regulator [Enterococcus sp. MMGLQ5-2]|uniref:MurR/RpiR family transcriptional regulator n=1 Tax=Enterococcus sp. MMGLQ5-2 TaxID=2737664 RepID=UPI001552DA4A|nr:MurR/RpiR family transcriptional regulator [Enterococcus sp. MMGLQ5-2]MBS7576735.1 MurR/RpiR family transcriptional regulator [Enterococcus sp. MMGLQ5-2]MBS7583778.1 MurR/RpiR family transcriptional regulator [Enterococcus sp. MMGLQ5-1]NPD11639.1 MurR/RpiR family transcriptional regulator [Enterococcus sp. MMGLQ5-1]NPD36572.1 MurR/RpiR family transcriptional regulator [Enterococcus sp. MMGLQ5-2]
MNFEQQVRSHYKELTTNELEMVQFIILNKEKVVNFSIVELGEALLSSKSSVLRLAKKVGFQGFSELKFALRKSIQEAIIEPEDLVSKLRSDIDRTFHIVNQTNLTPLLMQIKKARLVFLFATGFSQNNALKEFGKDLLVSGRSNMLISGETNLAISETFITKDDLVLIAGLSGETSALKDIIPALKMNKVPIAAITEVGKNYLQDHADYNLYFESSQIPSQHSMHMQVMTGLNITLEILALKYFEYSTFDE